MKKLLVVALFTGLLVVFASGQATAAQICWNIEGFYDIIKVAVTRPDARLPYKQVTGFWYGTDTPVSGSMFKTVDGTRLIVTLSGQRYDFWFTTMRLDLDPTTKSGTMYMYNHKQHAEFTYNVNRVSCSAPLQAGWEVDAVSGTEGVQ